MTLLELLVVLSIAALALSVVVASFASPSGRTRLKPLAIEIATDLKRARLNAMALGTPVSVLIEPRRQGYVIEGVSHRILPAGTGLSWTMPRDTPKLLDARRVTFFPDGSATQGLLQITNVAGETVKIDVNGITGTVEVLVGKE